MLTDFGDDSGKQLLELRASALHCLGDGIWLAEANGDIVYRNPVAADMESMFWSRGGNVGTLDDVVLSQAEQLLAEREHFISEFHLSGDEDSQRNVVLEIRRLGSPAGYLIHARDVSREWMREQHLHDRHIELENAYKRLKETQLQLLQSEKMASIGQLAAGVAHEINNPIGYVHSNLGTLQNYVSGLLQLLDGYDGISQMAPPEWASESAALRIREVMRQIDYAFIRSDLPQLLAESREGIERVKKIVMDLRDFSHSGQEDANAWVKVDIHSGIESTLNIVWNELKYKTTIHRNYGKLPRIQCIPSQINQVLLNLLINAGQAIESKGEITIATSASDQEICICIQDNGIGMTPEVRKRIFDPFYTTKPVGKGTGLGLSLSYGIIQHHNGRIEVSSQVGVGSTFRIYLPIDQSSVHSNS